MMVKVVRVKICGLMRLSDVRAAVESGADALGFVVASPNSRRNLSITKAKKLVKSVPVFASKVAVTSSYDGKTLRKICAGLNPDALQLHRPTHKTTLEVRKERPEIKLILATPVRGKSSVVEAKKASQYSDAILTDSLSADSMGGTGRTHDWNLTAMIREEIFPHPLILAGGLTPDNVRLAIMKVRPYAVDVSTGVETRIGVKDPMKIRGFIRNAKETLA